MSAPDHATEGGRFIRATLCRYSRPRCLYGVTEIGYVRNSEPAGNDSRRSSTPANRVKNIGKRVSMKSVNAVKIVHSLLVKRYRYLLLRRKFVV